MSVETLPNSLADWRTSLEDLKSFVGPVFGRKDLRGTAVAFIDAVLSGVERKTGWMLSEEAGFDKPYRMQTLLGRSTWSADALCDLVRQYAMEALGDPAGVLVIDETGFLKKGEHSVGVARQYSGTAGRIENCQIGVFASYASRWGHALIDRQLYLPKTWAVDPARRAKVHVPQEIGFATKPQMARDMVTGLLDEGITPAFVLADAVYGSDSSFRRMLEQRGQSYVLGVRSNHTLRRIEGGQVIQTDPATLIEELDAKTWQALAAGEGAKGPRLYEWARLPIGKQSKDGRIKWVLARRSRHDIASVTYYFAYAPANTTLAELAAAAGMRWTIEECFLRAKDDLGLDHCEARSWHGWHRHMSLVMVAAAFLAKLSADQRRIAFGKANKTSPVKNRIA